MRVLKSIVRIAAGALIGFHAWLIVDQAAAGRLSDPWLLVRWAAAAALTVALIALYRSSAPILGQRSVTVWLLAAMLHAPAVAARTEALNLGSLPEAAAVIAVQAVAAAATAGVAIWILFALLRRAGAMVVARSRVSAVFSEDHLDTGFALVVSARPPPAA